MLWFLRQQLRWVTVLCSINNDLLYVGSYGTARMVCGAGSMKRYNVCVSVCFSCRFAAVGLAGRRFWLIAAAVSDCATLSVYVGRAELLLLQPFNGPFSGTTRVSRYQKGETNLDFTGARDSEWQWHQLGHMQVCTSLQTDNDASTPPLCFLQAGCPSCRPTNSIKALKAQVELNRFLFQSVTEVCFFCNTACSVDCIQRDAPVSVSGRHEYRDE